jgi:hypothetical protein
MNNDKNEDLTMANLALTSDGWEENVEEPLRLFRKNLAEKFEKDFADWMLTPLSGTKH